jgi:CelD/BcsL family acetyltransferase involved in cellulose biosynthesis
MLIDVIEGVNDFHALRGNWERVYQADPEAQFFLSWQWLADWLATHPGIWFVLAAKRQPSDTEYAAFLALRMRTSFDKKTGFYNELFLAGDGFSDYNGILTRPECETETVPALAEFVKRRLNWACFRMDNLTMSDGRRRLFLRAFDKMRFVHNEISYLDSNAPTNHAICPSIRLPETWDDYLDLLSGNNRRKIRRLLKKVDAARDCSITCSDTHNVDQNLETLLEFWKIKWTPSKGENAEAIARRSYIMLSRCAEKGSLFLPVFWQGDKPVAALATLVDECKRSLLFFITGRDETYRELPAGYLLHAYSIRHAIAHGFMTYDFLKGNEPYKYLFAPQVERRQKPVSVVTKSGRNLGGKLDAKGLPAMLEMTLEFENQDRSAETELGYRQILELAPDNALALYRFGRFLAKNGDHAEAKKLLTRSVEVEPEGDNAWFYLGQSLQALGEEAAALAAYREVVRLQPRNKAARELLVQLNATAQPQRPAASMPWPIEVPAAALPLRGADPDVALRKQLDELRNLTQDYFDAFVNPRPQL